MHLVREEIMEDVKEKLNNRQGSLDLIHNQQIIIAQKTRYTFSKKNLKLKILLLETYKNKKEKLLHESKDKKIRLTEVGTKLLAKQSELRKLSGMKKDNNKHLDLCV